MYFCLVLGPATIDVPLADVEKVALPEYVLANSAPVNWLNRKEYIGVPPEGV
jgi:hypothetical protein